MSFLEAAGLFPFLSPEHHNYPNYYHHRNPRSPYDIDRSPVWYVQKLCHHYCEPVNHPPRFALSLHGVRRKSARYDSLNSPACSWVSITLPSSLNTRMIGRCEREREQYFAYATA